MCKFRDNIALSNAWASSKQPAVFAALPSPHRLDYGAGLATIDLWGCNETVS
jgi:hypothetical protein